MTGRLIPHVLIRLGTDCLYHYGQTLGTTMTPIPYRCLLFRSPAEEFPRFQLSRGVTRLGSSFVRFPIMHRWYAETVGSYKRHECWCDVSVVHVDCRVYQRQGLHRD